MRVGVSRKRRPQVAADTLERPQVPCGHTHSHLPAKQCHKHEIYQNIQLLYLIFSIYLKVLSSEIDPAEIRLIR
jgi:hypothetical protein